MTLLQTHCFGVVVLGGKSMNASFTNSTNNNMSLWVCATVSSLPVSVHWMHHPVTQCKHYDQKFNLWLSFSHICQKLCPACQRLWREHVPALYMFACTVFPWQVNSFEISDMRTADTGPLFKIWYVANLPLFLKGFSCIFPFLFPRAVWPAMSSVLRCSLIDFESCKITEVYNSWPAWGGFPLSTQKGQNVKCLKSYPALCQIYKLNFGL